MIPGEMRNKMPKAPKPPKTERAKPGMKTMTPAEYAQRVEVERQRGRVWSDDPPAKPAADKVPADADHPVARVAVGSVRGKASEKKTGTKKTAGTKGTVNGG